MNLLQNFKLAVIEYLYPVGVKTEKNDTLNCEAATFHSITWNSLAVCYYITVLTCIYRRRVFESNVERVKHHDKRSNFSIRLNELADLVRASLSHSSVLWSN